MMDGESSAVPCTTQCYCHIPVSLLDLTTPLFHCEKCSKYFHPDCLQNGKPSVLDADTFFHFVCKNCAQNGEEEFERMRLQWFQVVLLTLYNLQLAGGGKFGYFRWKEHICAFIDKHWNVLFASYRKKTSLWHGTVAGTLSTNCPQHFISGAHELMESGWWRLAEMKPPVLKLGTIPNRSVKKKLEVLPKNDSKIVKVEGLRNRRGKTSIEAAMELKARRSTLMEVKDIKQAKRHKGEVKIDPLLSVPTTPENSVISPQNTVYVKQEPEEAPETPVSSLPSTPKSSTSNLTGLLKAENDDDSHFSNSSSARDLWWTEKDLEPCATLPEFLMTGDENELSDSDIEIDPGTISPPHSDSQSLLSRNSPSIQDILSVLDKDSSHHDAAYNELDSLVKPCKGGVSGIKSEEASVVSSESDDTDQEEDDQEGESEDDVVTTRRRVRRKRKNEPTDINIKSPPKRYYPVSLYEEKQLLNNLNLAAAKNKLDPDMNRLRRKLILHKIKRERGLPLFDLDAEVREINRNQWASVNSEKQLNMSQYNPYNTVVTHIGSNEHRILDRFQTSLKLTRYQSHQFSSFLNRLVGTDEEKLACICSPYTARTLKPFIRRDYETFPMKMKLLEEIKAYPYRKDPEWKAPKPPPVDYCYVRPEHIPSVNMLCREFFWPGIDLSECLQFPDFSCVVLFRKIVIGFAFMVPDVKYNEAYISFIFTHPEWRGSGIATFMLYHLIQTCMGKDVTLHVSATNQAMLLYQKFGFKREEFIIDFYDKYYPAESSDCKHAFFLRLRR